MREDKENANQNTSSGITKDVAGPPSPRRTRRPLSFAHSRVSSLPRGLFLHPSPMSHLPARARRVLKVSPPPFPLPPTQYIPHRNMAAGNPIMGEGACPSDFPFFLSLFFGGRGRGVVGLLLKVKRRDEFSFEMYDLVYCPRDSSLSFPLLLFPRGGRFSYSPPFSLLSLIFL